MPVRGSAAPYRAIGEVFGWLCVAGALVLTGLAVRRPEGRP
ncbi:hypothetical protein ACFQ0B_43105 [Nonomuraea thailandensis]